MSEKRSNSWAVAGTAAVGVGVLAGLGYALYKASQDEESPVGRVVDSFFSPSQSRTPEPSLSPSRASNQLSRANGKNTSPLAALTEAASDVLVKRSPLGTLNRSVGEIVKSSPLKILNMSDDAKVKSSPLKTPNRSGKEKVKASPMKTSKNATPNNRTPKKRFSPCEVCQEPDKHEILILPCGHSFHISCLSANYTVHTVMGNNPALFACPVTSCKRVVPQTVIDCFEEQSEMGMASDSEENYEDEEYNEFENVEDKEVESEKSSTCRSGRHSKTLIEHCGICNESLHVSPTYELPCDHVFHKDCLKLRYPFRLHYGQSHKNACPIKSCNQVIPLSIIQKITRF